MLSIENPEIIEINGKIPRNGTCSQQERATVKNIIDRRLIGREHQYIQEVLNEEFRTSSGATMMKRLEAAFADCFESKYAIFVNGTATIHAALEAMDIGPGDEA